VRCTHPYRYPLHLCKVPFLADFEKKTSNDLKMINSFLKMTAFIRRICGSLKSVGELENIRMVSIYDLPTLLTSVFTVSSPASGYLL
jgi:hypothetical protein